MQKNRYRVKLTRFASCQLLTAPSSLKISCSGGVTFITVDSSIISELDVFCPSVLTNCNGGTADGYRKAVFYYNFDLNDNVFANLRNCNTLNLETQIGNIVSSTTSFNFHVAQMSINLDTNQTNCSPKFTVDPNPILCCNSPSYLAIGAIDSDGDSLSFEWGQAKGNNNNIITYLTGSNDNPFTTYYPGSQSFPFSAPGANPPIGINLNPKTGEVIFTPTRCTETSIVSIKVNEWRKDTNGIAQLIGSTQRVMKYVVTTCGNNDVPTVSGPSAISVCLGDSINLAYTSGERIVTNPRYTLPRDSVFLSWNGALQGANFSIVQDTGLYQSAVFSWKPDSSVELNKPYSFIITAEDNNCPLPSKVRKTVNVTVRDRVLVNLVTQNLGCGKAKYTLASDVACLDGTVLHNFELLTSTGEQVNSNEGHVSFQPNTNVAFVNIRKPGIYIVKSTLYNDLNTYSKTFVDTLDYSDILYASLGFQDTILCLNETINIVPQIYNSLGAPSYLWTTDDNDSNLYTNSTFQAMLTTPNSEKVLFLDVSDQTGCHFYDTVTVSNVFLEAEKLVNDTFCSNQPKEISIQGDYTNFRWNDESGDSIFSVGSSMILHLQYTDTNSCTYKDTANYTVLPSPDSQLQDTIHCGIPYILTIKNYPNIAWSDGSSSSEIEISKSGVYSLFVENGFGCQTRDTAHIELLTFNKRSLPNDTVACGGSLNLFPGVYDNYMWNSGESSSSLNVFSSGVYSVFVSNANGCSRTDSMDVVLLKNPNVPALSILTDRIQSDKNGQHKWFKNNTIQVAKTENYLLTTSKGRYRALTVDENGCESDTSEVLRVTLSAPKPKLSYLNIYPNPTSGKLTIDAAGLGKVQHVRLYDAKGALVEATQATKGSLLTLTWEARSGIYWVEVVTDSGVYRAEVMSVR